MSKAINTRNDILDASLDFIQKYSVDGFSFQDVAKKVGIKKGSMYYHFESKDDLILAILERSQQQLEASFARGSDKTAGQRMEYFINIFRNFIAPAHKMCPAGVTAGGWDKLSTRVKDGVKKLFYSQLKGLEDIVRDGREAGEFADNDKSAEAVALWIISSMQGGLVTSRVMGNPQPFELATELVMDYLTNG